MPKQNLRLSSAIATLVKRGRRLTYGRDGGKMPSRAPVTGLEELVRFYKDGLGLIEVDQGAIGYADQGCRVRRVRSS